MIVVDASIAAKWLFREDHTEKALDLATAALVARERILAPPVLWIEVANILRQRMHRFGMPLAQALDLFDRFLEVPVSSHFPRGLVQRALVLADQHQLPAVYDAHYVALAEMLGCDLWTDDRRLLRAVGRKLQFVKWIGEYPPPPLTPGFQGLQ